MGKKNRTNQPGVSDKSQNTAVEAAKVQGEPKDQVKADQVGAEQNKGTATSDEPTTQSVIAQAGDEDGTVPHVVQHLDRDPNDPRLQGHDRPVEGDLDTPAEKPAKKTSKK